ncbi:hypothetical protein [Psychromonas sp. L1A2]|nr:hypothetical protein [Psychromonas sp. L1A2]
MGKYDVIIHVVMNTHPICLVTFQPMAKRKPIDLADKQASD